MAEGGYDEFVFDDDFVRGAAKHEPSAEARAERARTARAAHEDLLEQRRQEDRRQRRGGRRGRGRLKAVAVLVVFAVATAAAIRFRDIGPRSAAPWTGEHDPAPVQEVLGQRPTPTPPPIDVHPTPPAVRTSGSFAFVAQQPGSAQPVGYDPCRPIAVVVNNRTMPAGAETLVAEALRLVRGATGLTLSIEGPTTEKPSTRRPPFQPERYGDRWAPVLIAWSDPGESPELAGGVGGYGGSVRTQSAEREVFVSGAISLDGPQLADILDGQDGHARARAVVLHELGHVVGLAHVQDEGEIMNPTGGDVTSYQAGDRSGLAQLGALPCVASL